MAEVRDGKFFCTYCGREVPPSLNTDFPCTVSVKQPFDENVQVDVWNCQARVFIDGKHIDEVMQITDAEKEEIDRLALESIESVGGTINRSGFYPPSDALVKYVEDLKKIKHIP